MKAAKSLQPGDTDESKVLDEAKCDGGTAILVHFLPFVSAADPVITSPPVLFSESFDDPRLLKRDWYDGSRFAITDTQAYSGKGCIEYSWKPDTTTPGSSSGIRHLFDPTDTVHLRCYLRLSKDWGWSGRPYHRHLMQVMTTENEKFAGPAASHLTV